MTFFLSDFDFFDFFAAMFFSSWSLPIFASDSRAEGTYSFALEPVNGDHEWCPCSQGFQLQVKCQSLNQRGTAADVFQFEGDTSSDLHASAFRCRLQTLNYSFFVEIFNTRTSAGDGRAFHPTCRRREPPQNEIQ